MTTTQSVLTEAEVIKELLEEILVVRQHLSVTEADLQAYREMVAIQSAQLHETLIRVERQTATNIRLRDEIARLREQRDSLQAMRS